MDSKRYLILFLSFLILLGCGSANTQSKPSFLPILNTSVSDIKLWGYGINGKETTLEETRNILDWVNGVDNFWKVENYPHEHPAPMSEIKIYFNNNRVVSISHWDENLLMNDFFQFDQPDLHKLLDDLAGY